MALVILVYTIIFLSIGMTILFQFIRAPRKYMRPISLQGERPEVKGENRMIIRILRSDK